MADVKQILPPSEDRALIYQTKNFTEVKTLLADGSVIEGIPVVTMGSTNQVSVSYFDGDVVYECCAAIGSELSSSVWQIKRTTVSSETAVEAWANGSDSFVNKATDLATVKSLVYS